MCVLGFLKFGSIGSNACTVICLKTAVGYEVMEYNGAVGCSELALLLSAGLLQSSLQGEQFQALGF